MVTASGFDFGACSVGLKKLRSRVGVNKSTDCVSFDLGASNVRDFLFFFDLVESCADEVYVFIYCADRRHAQHLRCTISVRASSPLTTSRHVGLASSWWWWCCCCLRCSVFPWLCQKEQTCRRRCGKLLASASCCRQVWAWPDCCHYQTIRLAYAAGEKSGHPGQCSACGKVHSCHLHCRCQRRYSRLPRLRMVSGIHSQANCQLLRRLLSSSPVGP